MFKIINKNIILQSLLFVLLLAYSILLIFTQLEIPEMSGEEGLYTILSYILNLPQVFVKITILIVLLLQLAFLQMFFLRSKFTETKTFFPVIIYLLLLIANKSFCTVSPVFFLNLTVILLFLLSSFYEEFSIKTIALLSGIVIGISFFIEPSSPILLAFVFASLFINRFTKTKDALVAIFGFFLPIIYFFAISFLQGNLYAFRDIYGNAQLFGFYHSINLLTVPDMIYMITLLLGLFYMILFLQLMFTQKLIILRRRLMGVNIMTLVLLVLSFFSIASYPQLLDWLFIPIACYFGMATQYKQRWLFHDLLLVLIIILLWI